MKDTFINCARELTVAVIGDIMLDVYVDGTVERLSPEAPNCIVLDQTKISYAVGGAANVAHNLAYFGAKTRLCGTLGTMENEHYHMVLADRIAQVCEASEQMFGSLEFFPVAEAGTRVCTVKTRYRSDNQQMLRVDREHRHPVVLGADPNGDCIGDTIKRCIDGVDVVILSDYGKGMLSDAVLAFLLPLLADEGIIYVVDPKRTCFADYMDKDTGAWPAVICPNYKEWKACEEYKDDDARTIHSVPHVIVTDGARGCFEATWDDSFGHWIEKYHTLRQNIHVADTAGAGDTFIAALTITLMGTEHDKLVKKDISEACQIANCLASLAVQEPGVALPDLSKAGELIGEEVGV
jgi:D-beta-D-heptose 7-phosphate kinase/D-beta-D-heptose 1-phosphate adenosyltransferase